MRLRRLDLTRYGRFTGQTLDFGPRVEGQPDLHIVYGPNEAGKSTAFAAYLDVLFGIEAQSRYGFLHPYPAMRIGACLELAGGPRELVRLKRAPPSLRDIDNTPLGEGIILSELGGLDRATYRTMFSLDDDSLEAGGEGILASKGELGQLLFSASAGLAELGKTLAGLRAEAEGFHKGVRSGELAQLKAALTALKIERDGLDTVASEYNRMADDRDRAAVQYDEAQDAARATRVRHAAVLRLLAALPRMTALGQLAAELAPLEALPDAPPGWLAELPKLQDAETAHGTKAKLAEAEIARRMDEAAAIEPDPAALALAGGLEHLAGLRARHATAELDLPARRRDLSQADNAVAAVLALLGRDGEAAPARLLLAAAQTAALRGLIEARPVIDRDVATASAELADAVQLHHEARLALHDAAGSPDTPPSAAARLRLCLAASRDSDHAPRLRANRRARATHAEEVADNLAALSPWTGEAAALAALAAPDDASVRCWESASVKASERLARLAADVERAEREWAQRQAECDAVGRTQGLVDDHEAAAIRGAREAAWAAHRRTLATDTADAFEAALRRDDMVGSARLGHERGLAKLHETAQAADIKKAEVARARALLGAATAETQTANDKVAAEIAAIHPALALPALPGWLKRRQAALDAWAKLREAERDIVAAREDEAALRQHLGDALAAAGIAHDAAASLDTLVALGQVAIDGEARVRGLRDATAACERDITRRERALLKASQADKEWRATWNVACGACWLGPDRPVDAVRDVLAALADLAPALQARAGLADRITAMRDDQAAFAQEVTRIAAALGVAREERSWLDLAQMLVARIEAAIRARDALRATAERLAAAREAHRRIVGDAALHAARAGEILAHCQAGSLMEAASALRDAERKAELRRRLRETEAEILSTLQAASLPDAQAMLTAVSQPDLAAEQTELASRLEDLERRARELFAAHTLAIKRIEAVGGDDAVARIEERRRTKLLEIEDKAGHYLRLRVGIAAADRALRAYRDQHQSAMMARASDAFRLISRGAYRGLSTQPGRDGDILVAVGADGASKLATDLSKGTRFQLYLALRAAGYREFARSRQPVPFIADDIMETFDDFRAEEALRLFAEMARVGQVIYLTHHDHLRAMAERAIPGVRVHRLAAANEAGSPLPNRAHAG